MDFLRAIIKHLGVNCTVTLKDGETDETVVTNYTAFDDAGNELTIDYDAVQTIAEQAVSDYTATEYQRNRAKAYPSIGEQLDMIFHAGLGGDEFQAAIQAVKDAHPKPE